MKMVLSSDNAGKIREFRSILQDCGIELLSKREAGCEIEVEETGESFAENAYLKAKAICDRSGLPAIADDSGLCVDALGGAPGVHSARFTGSHEDSDEARNTYLLHLLEGAETRKAHFETVICCVLPDGRTLYTSGICKGEISDAPRGTQGFGYDPVFVPEGFHETMGELGLAVKNAISHRARALEEFKKQWENFYDQQ